jgi:hypothetical protein
MRVGPRARKDGASRHRERAPQAVFPTLIEMRLLQIQSRVERVRDLGHRTRTRGQTSVENPDAGTKKKCGL